MVPRNDSPIKRTIRRQRLREMVPLADSTIYEMEQRGNFRGASLSRPIVSSGTSRRSRPGWLRADQSPLFARSLPTSGTAIARCSRGRVGFAGGGACRAGWSAASQPSRSA